MGSCHEGIPTEKAAEIVRLRTMGMLPEEVAERLGVSRFTVYNYLNRHQAFAYEAFVREFREEVDVFQRLYCDGNRGIIPLSESARQLALLFRKYSFMPEVLLAQAILNAHWRLRACRKRRRST